MLHEEQRWAVDDSLADPRNGFWMTMGSGKTLAAISFIQEKKADKNMIVVQPSNMYYWQQECEKYLDYDVYMIKSLDSFKRLVKSKKFNKDRFVLILKHQSYWREPWKRIYIENNIVEKETVVIIDESKVVSGVRSGISKFTRNWLSKQVIDLHQLTGTMLSTLDNTYVPLKLAGYDDLTFKKFEDAFLEINRGFSKQNGKLYEFKTYTGLKPGADKTIRYMVHNCGTVVNADNLSVKYEEKVFQEIPLVMESACKSTLKVVCGPAGDRLIEGIYPLENSSDAMVAARQLASGFYKPKKILGGDTIVYSNHKIQAVEDLCMSTDDDYLIFYVFKEECKQLQELFTRLKIKVFLCNGDVKTHEQRYDYKGRKVLLVQYQAGSDGLNLQDFHRTIYYSPTWSPHQYMQSQGRTNRIGQKHTCYYYKLITKNTAEKRTYETLEKMKEFNDYLMMSALGLKV